MPYIKSDERAQLNFVMEEVVRGIIRVAPNVVNRSGRVNYIITRIVARSMKPNDGWSYASISRAIAVLRDAATEMERRLMAPTEDYAIHFNGDLPEYDHR